MKTKYPRIYFTCLVLVPLTGMISFVGVGCAGLVLYPVVERLRTPWRITIETEPPNALAVITGERNSFITGSIGYHRIDAIRGVLTDKTTVVTNTTPCFFHPRTGMSFVDMNQWTYTLYLSKPGYQPETVDFLEDPKMRFWTASSTFWDPKKRGSRRRISIVLKRLEPPKIEPLYSYAALRSCIGYEYPIILTWPFGGGERGGYYHIFATTAEPPSGSAQELQQFANRHPVPLEWGFVTEEFSGPVMEFRIGEPMGLHKLISLQIPRRKDLVGVTLYLTAVGVDSDGGVHIGRPYVLTIVDSK